MNYYELLDVPKNATTDMYHTSSIELQKYIVEQPVI